MAYRYKNETYRFLVNGQTGKAPYSPMKIVAIAAVLIAIVLLAFLLPAWLGGAGGHLGMNMDGPGGCVCGRSTLFQNREGENAGSPKPI